MKMKIQGRSTMIEYLATASTTRHIFKYGERDSAGKTCGTVTDIESGKVVFICPEEESTEAQYDESLRLLFDILGDISEEKRGEEAKQILSMGPRFRRCAGDRVAMCAARGWELTAMDDVCGDWVARDAAPTLGDITRELAWAVVESNSACDCEQVELAKWVLGEDSLSDLELDHSFKSTPPWRKS